MHHAGLTELNHENITPIAMVDVVPASVLVANDSEFESLEQLLDYARENPGELTVLGAPAQGGIWHLALAGMLLAEGDGAGCDPLGAVRRRGQRDAGS